MASCLGVSRALISETQVGVNVKELGKRDQSFVRCIVAASDVAFTGLLAWNKCVAQIVYLCGSITRRRESSFAVSATKLSSRRVVIEMEERMSRES